MEEDTGRRVIQAADCPFLRELTGESLKVSVMTEVGGKQDSATAFNPYQPI